MTEHKTNLNITKINKCRNNWTAEYKTDMNITEKLSSIFTKEHETENNYNFVNIIYTHKTI